MPHIVFTKPREIRRELKMLQKEKTFLEAQLKIHFERLAEPGLYYQDYIRYKFLRRAYNDVVFELQYVEEDIEYWKDFLYWLAC